MNNIDFIEFWAHKFKKDPQKNRKLLKEFINSQIMIANERLKKLNSNQLIEIFNIENDEFIQELKDIKNKRK